LTREREREPASPAPTGEIAKAKPWKKEEEEEEEKDFQGTSFFTSVESTADWLGLVSTYYLHFPNCENFGLNYRSKSQFSFVC
jgi:hypothetical protein